MNQYTWFLFFSSVLFALFNHIITSASIQQKRDILFISRNGEEHYTEEGDSFAEESFSDEDARTSMERLERSVRLDFVDWYRYILCLENVSNSTTYEMIDQENEVI